MDSEKEELKTVAAAKVEQITAELKTGAPSDKKAFDPVENIKQGFITCSLNYISPIRLS